MNTNRLLKIMGIIILMLILIVLALNLLAQPAADYPFFHQFDQYPLVIAHSDDVGYGIAPGDTLLFFEKAADLGVDVLEMNVQLTADGNIILMHDDTVDGTTNGSGKVSEMTLDEIKELEVGFNWSQDDGETYPYRGAGLRVPTIDEVFQAFPDYPMNIEIKAESTQAGEQLCAKIQEYNMTDKVLVASSRDEALVAFRNACPDVATSANRGEVTQFVLLSYALWANPAQPAYQALQVPEKSSGILIMRPGFVNAAHRRNVQVHVWTIDDPQEMQRYLDMGVDAILTNKPAVLMEMLGR